METKQKTLEEKRNDQIVSDALRLKSMVGLSLSNEECQRFIKGIYNEAAELYAGQTKQSEPVSLEVDVAPKWIVNSMGELGVEVNGRQFFLYKGDNIEYNKPGKHPDNIQIQIILVKKRTTLN